MDEALAAYKALADKSRLRILYALGGGELCACRLVELLGVRGATVSQHLAVLQQGGLCRSRKEGRWVYYALADSPFLPDFTPFQNELSEDRTRLKTILSIPAEELCKIQRDGKSCC